MSWYGMWVPHHKHIVGALFFVIWYGGIMLSSLLSASINTLAISFLLLLACYTFLTQSKSKNVEIVFVSRCLFAVFTISTLALIQFIALDVGGMPGGILHVYGVVVPAIMVRNDLKRNLPQHEKVADTGPTIP
jgi:hypothetical protein